MSNAEVEKKLPADVRPGGAYRFLGGEPARPYPEFIVSCGPYVVFSSLQGLEAPNGGGQSKVAVHLVEAFYHQF